MAGRVTSENDITLSAKDLTLPARDLTLSAKEDHVRFPVTLYLNRDVKVSRLGLDRTARILLKRDESFLRLALRKIEFGDCLIRDEKIFRLALRKFPNFRIFETVYSETKKNYVSH